MESNRTRPLVAIVDDEVFVRRSMRRLVSAWGIEAAPFSSGRAFIEMLEQSPSFQPDCAILDIAMPGENGLQVLKDAKARRPSLPVIIVTATDDEQTRDEALIAGAAGVFRKPVDDELFILALHEVLKII